MRDYCRTSSQSLQVSGVGRISSSGDTDVKLGRRGEEGEEEEGSVVQTLGLTSNPDQDGHMLR